MRAGKGLKRLKPNSGKCMQWMRASGDSLDGKKGVLQHTNVTLFNIPDNNSWLEASYVSGGSAEAAGGRGGILTTYLCDK